MTSSNVSMYIVTASLGCDDFVDASKISLLLMDTITLASIPLFDQPLSLRKKEKMYRKYQLVPGGLLVIMLVSFFREMDLLLVPYWADRELEIVQWPPFLLASKVSHISFFWFSPLPNVHPLLEMLVYTLSCILVNGDSLANLCKINIIFLFNLKIESLLKLLFGSVLDYCFFRCNCSFARSLMVNLCD